MFANLLNRANNLLPGVGACVAVTVTAIALDRAQAALFGRAWLETIVLAIILGAIVRAVWRPDARWAAGIRFSAKTLLEIAVVLLGASLSTQALLAAGPMLPVGIAMVVASAISLSYGAARLIGLSKHQSILVACGNSICGNSAIAATAPVIGANGDDVASTIAFTAVIGVPMVLCLPLLVPLLGLSDSQYGVLAGLTVYAVPQVIAATAPVSALAVQVGTLVKLVRVLMLGPVVLVLAMVAGDKTAKAAHPGAPGLVPWFIVGFLAMMTARGFNMIPEAALAPMATASSLLTALSMAALGLSVDFRAALRSGGAVIGAAIISLALLMALSLALLVALQIQ